LTVGKIIPISPRFVGGERGHRRSQRSVHHLERVGFGDLIARHARDEESARRSVAARPPPA